MNEPTPDIARRKKVNENEDQYLKILQRVEASSPIRAISVRTLYRR
jgi:hypothetical protein